MWQNVKIGICRADKKCKTWQFSSSERVQSARIGGGGGGIPHPFIGGGPNLFDTPATAKGRRPIVRRSGPLPGAQSAD